MDGTRDGETAPGAGNPATQPDMVLPGMLPPDGGLASAPDAEERLARAVSRYWAIQALQVRDFGDGIGGVSGFRQRELNRRLLQRHGVRLRVQRRGARGRPPRWWPPGRFIE